MVAYTVFKPDARVRRHVAALLDTGHTVDVYALREDSGAEEFTREGLRFILPKARVSRSAGKIAVLVDYIMFMFACKFLLLKNHFGYRRYALIHINNMPNFLIAAAMPLRLLGVPVLLDIHDTMPEIYQDKFGSDAKHPAIRLLMLEERLSMWAAHYVLTTEHTKWERLLTNGLSRAKSCVVLNLPDFGVFPDRAPRTENTPDEVFRLIYHGTLTHRLGMDIAIRAVDIARREVPRIRFDIIGDGEQRCALVDLAQELQLDRHVFFSDGFVATEELPSLIEGTHLAVLPSRNCIGTSLMLPTKLLEYVRLGVPAVTVATPTITFYFDETMVRFVSSESPQDLADAIVQLHRDPAARLELAKQARTFYQRFDFTEERTRYLYVTDCLIRKRRPDPEAPAS